MADFILYGGTQSASASSQQTKWKNVSFQCPRRDKAPGKKKKDEIICKPNSSRCMSFTLTFIGRDGGGNGAKEGEERREAQRYMRQRGQRGRHGDLGGLCFLLRVAELSMC